MLKINIKPKAVEKIKKKRVSAWVIIVCLLLLIVSFVVSGFLYVSNASLVEKNNIVETNIQSQKADNASLLELDKKAKELDKILNAIKTLNDQSTSFSSLLKEVAAKTPHDVQVTDLLCDMTLENKMDISGKAASRRSIMQFRNELEKSDLFSNVDFVSSSQTEGGSFDFKITMGIKKTTKK